MQENPLILALETSGRKGSIAIAKGREVLTQTEFTAQIKHSAEIFPAISRLLQQLNQRPRQIRQVYLSAGPGSFTGIRIAVTIAKTFHLANKAQIVSVSSLDVIASNVINLAPALEPPLTSDEQRLSALSGAALAKTEATNYEHLAVVLDAKRGQFFIAVYQKKTSDQQPASSNGIWEKTLPDCLMTPSQFLRRFAVSDKPVALVGEGLVYHKEKFNSPHVQLLDERYWYPSAKNVVPLGLQKARENQFADPVLLLPNYLRTPDVKLKIPDTTLTALSKKMKMILAL
jgi:tRNA threonylcarbamoyl adenosine modification protein YeaZ